MELEKIFEAAENEPFWLMENDELLSENPFVIRHGKLFDRLDAIRDDVIGKAIRGVVVPVKLAVGKIGEGEEYFYINISGEAECRENKDDLLDIFNIITGNAFRTEAEAEAGKHRVLSVVRGLGEIGMCLFPAGIGQPMNLASAILEITNREHMSDEESMPGVLMEGFARMKNEEE